MDLYREIRQALRQLASTPSFTLPAVLVLGLGLGAATAMFSVVDAVLLRPLVPDQDRVVVLFPRDPTGDLPFEEISPPEFRDWRDGATSFQGLAAFNAGSSTNSLELEDGRWIDFRLVGVTPTVFENADELPRAERVLVLGQALFRDAFGADPAILGRTLRLGARAEDVYTVVGVMPRGFDFPNQTQAWMVHRRGERSDERGWQFLLTVGRLAPGVTLEEAQAEMEVVDERVLKETGRSWFADRQVQAVPILEFYLGSSAPAVVLILQVAVLLLFLVACVNVSGLFLSRNSARGRELSVRAALGATRAQIARALLVETGLVTVAGGALSLLVARAGLAAILALAPSGVPRLAEARLDLPSSLFAVMVSAAAAGLIGLGSTFRASRRSLSPTRSGDSPETLAGRRHLITIEVAASVVLALAASLMLASLMRLMRADFGYRSENVLMLEVDGPIDPLESPRTQQQLIRALIERFEVVPGVESAAAVLLPPFGGGKAGWDLWFVAESQGHGFVPTEKVDPATGRPAIYFAPAPGSFADNPSVNWEAISGSYFETMGIPLLSGRTFTDEDSEDAARVVIVGKSFAERLWPGEDAIGKRILTGGHRFDEQRRAEWQTVVGVVADARYREIEGSRLDVYVPYLQSQIVSGSLVLRTTGDPLAVLPSVRAGVSDVGSELRILTVRTLESAVGRELLPWRFQTALLTTFAVAALLITAVGIFGLLAHAVSLRTREIGLRMAVGAKSRDVMMLVLRQGTKPLFVGLICGLIVSYFSSEALAAHLYEVTPTDGPTYLAVTLVIAAVGIAAALVPARRAARIDAISVLKHE
jgi:putative ABC transport system permease protein